MLIAATLDKGGSSDPFWSLQSKALLGLFIRLILLQPKEKRHMSNVLHLLNTFASSPKKVDEWIVQAEDKKMLLEYKTFVSMPEKTLMNVVSSAKAALQLFDDPEIAKVTSHDSIDFAQLRLRPQIIFLHNSVSEMKYVNTLNGIVFEQLYGHILQDLPAEHELDLYIMLEEASSLYINILANAIANTRKHRVSNIILVQSPSQLRTFYGNEAESIQNNCCTKVFLPGITAMETLREIETLSGKMVYVDENKSERVKQLITIDEIRMLEEDRSLIISGNCPYILGRTSPYYKSWKYSARAKIKPLSLQGDIPETPISYIE
jgi:type IV secretion system protein VirD4